MCTCYMLWFYVKMLSSHLFCFEWYNWCVFFLPGCTCKKRSTIFVLYKILWKVLWCKEENNHLFQENFALNLIWCFKYIFLPWMNFFCHLYISILCCDVESITKDSTVLWHSISCIREKKIRHDSCMKWYKTQKYSLVIV